MRKSLHALQDDITLWLTGWYQYIYRHARRFGIWFETNKDAIVDILMARRGGYQKHFLHFSISVLIITAFVATPILTNAHPGGLPSALADFTEDIRRSLNDLAKNGLKELNLL